MTNIYLPSMPSSTRHDYVIFLYMLYVNYAHFTPVSCVTIFCKLNSYMSNEILRSNVCEYDNDSVLEYLAV
jgi:hypothetical protein